MTTGKTTGKELPRLVTGRIGIGLFTVKIAVAAGITLPTPVAAQQPLRGILVSPSVACRAAPFSSAVVVGNLTKTGDAYREGVMVGDSTTDPSGARWVSVEVLQGPLGRCWVPERTVIADSGADVLLAMADHLLAAPEGHALHDWVAVHNYFGSPRYREEVDASAALTLRRLEVLTVAVRLAQAGWGELDPRAVAWIESLGEEVEYSADRRGRMRWVVGRDTLDALYDAHREEPLAEEILWKTVRYPYDLNDCIRDSGCVFDLALGVSAYWLAYPRGSFVSEAIWTALGHIDERNSRSGGRGILQTCETARDAEPDSWWMEAWGRLEWESEGFPASRRLLATLSEVADEDKAPLVRYLGEVDRCAAEVGARRPLPEAEPEGDEPETPGADSEPAGSEEHVLAVADHFLASGERRTLDHSLRIFNLLNSRHHGYRGVVDGSALLTLRRLQVLGEVLATIDRYSADALTRGWTAQMEEVRMWSIGVSWYVRDEAFEKAFEEHRDTPRAEDILWELATGPAPHDCEGAFTCNARVEVMNKLARYWLEYPGGRYAVRAVEIAAGRLSGFLKTCRAAVGAEPESREARWWEYVDWETRGAAAASEIRASLRELADAVRAPLVELLDGLDRCAAEMSSEVGRIH